MLAVASYIVDGSEKKQSSHAPPFATPATSRFNGMPTRPLLVDSHLISYRPDFWLRCCFTGLQCARKARSSQLRQLTFVLSAALHVLFVEVFPDRKRGGWGAHLLQSQQSPWRVAREGKTIPLSLFFARMCFPAVASHPARCAALLGHERSDVHIAGPFPFGPAYF